MKNFRIPYFILLNIVYFLGSNIIITDMTVCYARSKNAEPKIIKSNIDTPLSGWKKWVIERKNLQPLDVYITGKTTSKQPILFLITGSKCRPLFDVKLDGKISSPLFSTDAKYYQSLGFTTVVMERRGVKSFEPIPADVAKLDPRVRCRDDYGAISKFDRIKDLKDTIQALRKEPWFGDIAIMGHSEGVDVATGLVKELGDKGIMALGLLAGASPSQFGDQILEARASADEKRVVEIFEDVIWMTSGNEEGKYGGYPLKRWKSFAIESTPQEDVRNSNVPIFIANGSRDTHAPIGSADAFALEVFRRQPKRALLYYTISDLDHDFYNAKDEDFSLIIIREFARWALTKEKGRKVSSSLPSAK